MSDTETQSTVSVEEECDPEEDLNIRLIRCVRDRTYLYTKTDKRYSDRNITERSWIQIAADLGISREEAKEKWTRLRNNFGKVLARRKAKKPAASSSRSQPDNKPWIYEAEMDFLKKHISLSTRVLSSSLSGHSGLSTPSPSDLTPAAHSATSDHDPQTEDTLTTHFSDQSLRSETVGTSGATQKRNSKNRSKSPDALDDAMISYLNMMTNQNEEPLLLWFKSLIPTLKALPPDKLFSFQIHMMQEIENIQRMASPQEERKPFTE